MIDIARDYTTPENMKKLIDAFASYKMNALHFHFSDDEGWRLEITGLEELTTVGSRRGHTTNESQCLYPGYDGGYDPVSYTHLVFFLKNVLSIFAHGNGASRGRRFNMQDT